MKLDVYFDDNTKVTLAERTSPPPPPPKPAVPLYMHKEDRDLWGSIRSCAPCPAVMVLKDDQHAIMNRQWQYYLRAINYNMTVENVYLLLDDRLAFANHSGFVSLDNPERADYFFNRDLNLKPPQLDKVRTMSRNVVTGTEQYSLMQSLADMAYLAKKIVRRETTFMNAKMTFSALATTNANVLKVWVFDSRQPPPLKPGRSYPTSISQVNPDDYLYLPETDREKFLVANIVNRKGEVVQFPRGALYPWFEGGRTIGSFLPHVANLGYGDVLYPLRKLQKVDSVPSPYRFID